MMIVVRVVTKRFVAGMVADVIGFVTDAAPILRWAKGKHYLDVIQYYQMKGSLVEFQSWEDGSWS